MHKYLMEESKEDGVKFYSVVPSEKTRGNDTNVNTGNPTYTEEKKRKKSM